MLLKSRRVHTLASSTVDAMAGGNIPNNEGRVTTRELYTALQDQNKERRKMEDRIMAKVDCIPAMKNQVDTNTKEIVRLRNRSNWVDVGLGAFTIFMAGLNEFWRRNG